MKLPFLYLKPIHRLEKPDSWGQRLHGSRIPRTMDPESEHGGRYRVGVGSGYVLPIESGFLHPKPIRRLEKHDS